MANKVLQLAQNETVWPEMMRLRIKRKLLQPGAADHI